jgi:hypothetical protein
MNKIKLIQKMIIIIIYWKRAKDWKLNQINNKNQHKFLSYKIKMLKCKAQIVIKMNVLINLTYK